MPEIDLEWSTARTLPAHETCHHLTYLLSCEVYEQMLADTGELCEICGDHINEPASWCFPHRLSK